MKRLRHAALLAALLPAVSGGCTGFGNGPLMSRLHRDRGVECPCEVGMGPCCDGPALGDGVMAGPALPPPGAATFPTVPPLAPAPRLLDPAQPTPAAPTSRVK